MPQNFGRWWGPTSDTFCSHINVVRVVWTIKGGADTQTLLDVKIFLNFLHSQAAGAQKLRLEALTPGREPSRPTSQMVEFPVPYLFLLYKS